MYSENVTVKKRNMYFVPTGNSAYVNITVSKDVKNYLEKVLRNNHTAVHVAFNNSLGNSKLFTIDSLGHDYLVEATVLKCWQPNNALDYPTDLSVQYRVMKDTVIDFETTISNVYVNDFSNALVARKRARQSLEFALRENFEDFIQQAGKNYSKPAK